MIDAEFFLGFPFPWLLRNSRGVVIGQGDGALFPLSKAAQSDEEYRYVLNAGYGWTCCPSGYAAYVSSLSSDEEVLLVVRGLKVAGVSVIRGHEETLSIRMQKDQVEAFTKRTAEALRQSKEKLNAVMRTNIHEVRSINTDIYNAVYRLKENLAETGYDAERDSQYIRNIEELSKILKTRTDVLDVVSNPALLQAARGSIPIYRAFDRVVRSLKPSALAKGVRLNLTGSSTGRINGISLFDVIPYLMIQNAIKYSPKDTNATIEFSEEKGRVHAHLISVGPALEESESERIFISGFRGKYAQRVTTEGAGLGMHLLKMMVELHDGGAIEFWQDGASRVVREVPHRTTHLQVSIDLSETVDNGISLLKE